MRTFWLILAGCLVAGGCGGAHGESRTGGTPAVRVTNVIAETSTGDPGVVDAYFDAVKRASGGTLAITVKPRAHTGPAFERQVVAAWRAGRAPLGFVGAPSWDTTGVDDFQALVAPFAITTYGHEQRVLQSPTARQMLAGLSRHGLTGLALLPGPMRRLLGIDKP